MSSRYCVIGLRVFFVPFVDTLGNGVQFTIDPGAMSFNFKVPLDIIIGTVPLRESFPTFQPSAPPFEYSDVYNGGGGSSSIPPFTLAHYPDLRK